MTREDREMNAGLLIAIRDERHFPMMSPEIIAMTSGARALRILNRIEGHLAGKPEHNLQIIRDILKDELEEQK